MNWAHVHLLLNHIPIVAMPFALALLIFALWSKHEPTKTFALSSIIAIGALTIPVYLTGEPAEPFLKDLPGIMESLIKDHEEMGELSLIAVLVTAAGAAASLFLRSLRWRPLLLKGTLAFACVSVGLLGYTGFLGGKIRHTEIRAVSIDP